MSIRTLATAMMWLASAAVASAGPVGEWLVADQNARVAVDICDGHAWGVISWEKIAGGLDRNNPDPVKRSRPILGAPIIVDMKPAQNETWSGEIYNAENGKTYDARLSMKSPDVLRVEGCVLGFLCGGQDWTRYTPPVDPSARSRPATSASASRTAAARPGAPPPPSPVCAAVAKAMARTP